MPETASRYDPHTTNRFYVEIGSVQQAIFKECSGLQAETEVLNYEEGGVNGYQHKLPGRTKFQNVSLKWGISDSNELWDWYQDVMQGKIQRKNVSIVLCNQKGEEVKRWSFERAYPVKWQGPTFKADENAVAIETLDITHEGMTLKK